MLLWGNVNIFIPIDRVHNRLSAFITTIDATKFPPSLQHGIDIDDLLSTIFRNNFLINIMSHYGATIQSTVTHFLSNILRPRTLQQHFQPPPQLILIRTHSTFHLIKRFLTLTTTNASSDYHLTAVIYHGGFHFTAWFIDAQNATWYHNGISTQSDCLLESSDIHNYLCVSPTDCYLGFKKENF